MKLLLRIILLLLTGGLSIGIESGTHADKEVESELAVGIIYEVLPAPEVKEISYNVEEVSGDSMLHYAGDIVVEPEELPNLFNAFENIYGRYTLEKEHYTSYTYNRELGGMEKGHTECYELTSGDIILSIETNTAFDGTYRDPYYSYVILEGPSSEMQTGEAQNNLYTLLREVYSDDVARYLVYNVDEEGLEYSKKWDDATSIFSSEMYLSYDDKSISYSLSRYQDSYDNDGSSAFFDWEAMTSEFVVSTTISLIEDEELVIENREIPEINSNVENLVLFLDARNEKSSYKDFRNPNGVDRFIINNINGEESITFDFEQIMCNVLCHANGDSTITLEANYVFEWGIDFEKVESEFLNFSEIQLPGFDFTTWDREEGNSCIRYTKIINGNEYYVTISEFWMDTTINMYLPAIK